LNIVGLQTKKKKNSQERLTNLKQQSIRTEHSIRIKKATKRR